jgi:hypothetical protein
MPIVAAVACVAVLIVFGPSRGPEVVPDGSVSIDPEGGRDLDALPSLGVESIPLYDDIDAGMRAGVWMLASSLVEMPDWATLADFDADAESRDAPGP